MRHPENPEPSCLRCLFAVTLASGRGESLADGPLLAVLAVAYLAVRYRHLTYIVSFTLLCVPMRLPVHNKLPAGSLGVYYRDGMPCNMWGNEKWS